MKELSKLFTTYKDNYLKFVNKIITHKVVNDGLLNNGMRKVLLFDFTAPEKMVQIRGLALGNGYNLNFFSLLRGRRGISA